MGNRMIAAAAACLIAGSAFAATPAAPAAPAAAKASAKVTAKEAEAMVKRGIAHIKANPRTKAMADISDKNGAFIDRDLYLTVFTLEGQNLAHGANEKMIGKQLIDMKDIDGKEYLRERMDLARSKGAFWQDYKFVNPVTKKIEPKQMYCERSDDLVVCGGIYKP